MIIMKFIMKLNFLTKIENIRLQILNKNLITEKKKKRRKNALNLNQTQGNLSQ